MYSLEFFIFLFLALFSYVLQKADLSLDFLILSVVWLSTKFFLPRLGAINNFSLDNLEGHP